MFCFLEDSPIQKIEVSFLHELFHIQLCFSFANKNFHSFLLMIPFIVDLITSFGQFVRGWIHWGFIFYFNIPVGNKTRFILYFATLHSRAIRRPSMTQASRLFKACEQPLLWRIAFIHPQSRDEGLLELTHQFLIVTQRFSGLFAVKTIALALNSWIGSLFCSCYSHYFRDSCDFPLMGGFRWPQIIPFDFRKQNTSINIDLRILYWTGKV